MNAVMKPPKGHKKARTLSERCARFAIRCAATLGLLTAFYFFSVAKITKLMEDQDQKKEELRKVWRL